MVKGYWKLEEEADGWDTHYDKYVWVEEKDEVDRWGYPTGKKTYKKTDEHKRVWAERFNRW